MIRIIAKLFAVTVTLIVCLPVQPSSAGSVAFVSATGGGTACSQTAPCATIETAVEALSPDGGQIICMTPVEQNAGFGFSSGTFLFDCPSTSWIGGIGILPSGVSGVSGVFKFQHIDFSGLDIATSVIKVTGGGTLIFDDCILEDIAGMGLDIEPNSAFNLVVTNSRISNNAGGVLFKPAAGGSVTATFDRVTITGNSGGGLKSDTTNGPVTVDISNSTISKNAGNGLNAVSGAAGGTNILNLSHDVIASNGTAGIQSNGTNAAVLIDTTLLDSNATGATSAVGGGRLLTYGNNRIVGSAGSGFTGSAALQ
jgi:hypothetical protein